MAALLFLTPFHLTFRVAEPEVLARHLRFSANGVTARRLGGRSEATGAGNPVLNEVVASASALPGRQGRFLFHLRLLLHKERSLHKFWG